MVVPAGSFATGPIRLKSRVNLHLSEGAVLKFSTDPKDYLPVVYTRFEGTELMNYSPFIYAFDQQNIAITGSGTLDGQADNAHWWHWTRNAAASRRRLTDPATARMPVAERVFGEGAYLRPEFHSAVSLPQRAHRRRHDHQLADVGDSSGAVDERDRPRRDGQSATGRTTTAAIPNRAATC